MKAASSLAVAVAVVGAVSAQTPAEPKMNSVAAKAFTAKVQPVLSNLCADCHAHPKHASQFKLKPYDPAFNDPQTADANLRAVARFLDPANPHASALLTYSTTPHGKAPDPPLKAGHPALVGLELWVHWVCGPDGSAMPAAVPLPRASDKSVIQAGAMLPAAPPPPPPPAMEPGRLPQLKTTPLSSFAETKPKSRTTGANPDDPFDPAGFNKR